MAHLKDVRKFQWESYQARDSKLRYHFYQGVYIDRDTWGVDLGNSIHDLQQACAIAQIDKNDATMIPPPVNPTGNADGLSDDGLVDVTAVMTTHVAPFSWEGPAARKAGRKKAQNVTRRPLLPQDAPPPGCAIAAPPPRGR